MAYPTLYPPQVNSPSALTMAIDAAQTTIQVEDASILPAAPNLLVIGYGDYAETVLMTAKVGNNLTVLRAFQGTARAWAKGSPIARNFTAYDLAALNEWTNAIRDLARRMDAMEPQYIKDGLVLHLDGINNTGIGHSLTTDIWKNLAGDDDVELIVKSLDWDMHSIGFNNTTTPVDWGKWKFLSTPTATIEIIAYYSSITASMHIIGNLQSGGCAIDLTAATNRVGIANISDTYRESFDPAKIPASGFIKYTVTYDGNDLVTYANAGREIARGTYPGYIKDPGQNTIWALAVNPDGSNPTGGESFTGRIYSARLYDRALTPEEVHHNYIADIARYGTFIGE